MFSALLPSIEAQARYAFRRLRAEAKAEAIEEVIANAYIAFCRLVARGKAHVAKPTPSWCMHAPRPAVRPNRRS